MAKSQGFRRSGGVINKGEAERVSEQNPEDFEVDFGDITDDPELSPDYEIPEPKLRKDPDAKSIQAKPRPTVASSKTVEPIIKVSAPVRKPPEIPKAVEPKKVDKVETVTAEEDVELAEGAIEELEDFLSGGVTKKPESKPEIPQEVLIFESSDPVVEQVIVKSECPEPVGARPSKILPKHTFTEPSTGPMVKCSRFCKLTVDPGDVGKIRVPTDRDVLALNEVYIVGTGNPLLMSSFFKVVSRDNARKVLSMAYGKEHYFDLSYETPNYFFKGEDHFVYVTNKVVETTAVSGGRGLMCVDVWRKREKRNFFSSYQDFVNMKIQNVFEISLNILFV